MRAAHHVAGGGPARLGKGVTDAGVIDAGVTDGGVVERPDGDARRAIQTEGPDAQFVLDEVRGPARQSSQTRGDLGERHG
ncbi:MULTISPECIES: hypothetical protein [Dermacoccus]|uniref:hypothetical protein n=1 Tax=Dermacoccus TaxID=57495 RepID=UPI00068F947F|nr:hypothetical protein [Dermacoccus nishinomiyaensis]